MDYIGMLVKQINSMAWIRCCMEEGVDFLNKQTGEIEKNEFIIYDNLENHTGLFDVPNAHVSPTGMEKNLLEVIGYYIAYSDDEYLLFSPCRQDVQ